MCLTTNEKRDRMLVKITSLAAAAAAFLVSPALALDTAEPEIAALFCRSRLGGAHGLAFGTLFADAPVARLIDRAMLAA